MRQLLLSLPNTWGGRRRGAGRKPRGPRPNVSHRIRPYHDAAHPTHVTLRARSALPSLRGMRVFGALREAIRLAQRDAFRICHLPGFRRATRCACRRVLGSREPHSPAGRGEEPPGPVPGCSGPGDSNGSRAQSSASTEREGLGRPVSPPRPRDAPRGAPRAGLRARQREEAPARRRRAGMAGVVTRTTAS